MAKKSDGTRQKYDNKRAAVQSEEVHTHAEKLGSDIFLIKRYE